ncbi:HAD-IIB family hydrolase [Paracoccus aestuarii]|uniref:sucrose-phosphate synthase n=1 Tax=Paracoccus aestuarii TaxID=453842 RepID=A0A418ZWG5_9RHOB|nr:HAD-IIB family hydrolase [Paracoccus aestuarii]RJL04843.1 HAD-IIB family hydrolase [Paracoccus aestuarii]WCR01155.1 HAD-IIB family hydrolase [Paracoccus aestuarii]
MDIMHIALGGCLKAPPVRFGLTEDTGGHIAYVLGAAMAQAALPQVGGVSIVTRAFAGMDPVHDRDREDVGPKCRILRLRSGDPRYLAKEALEAQIPALTRALLAMLGNMDRRPDVIHAHFADAARLARAAERAFGIPWIYTPHSLALQKSPDAGRDPALRGRIRSERAAMAGAGAIILSSRDEAERQLAPYGAAAEGRAHVLPPGVTLAADPGPAAGRALIAPLLDRPDLPIVLAVARPVPKKNLGALIEAFAASPRLRAAANLVILAGQAGMDDDQARLRDGLAARVAALGLAGRVAMPPDHDADQLRALYAVAARGGVFANPAHHEPFGLTLIEAAQAGVAVVATRHGGPVDIIDRIGHGALVDPGDPRAIAAACLRMMRDRRGIPLAQARAATTYDWPRWAQASLRIAGRLRARAPVLPEAPRRILACDIDGTLTGCARSAEGFGRWHARRPDGLVFAVATGRSLPEARRVLQDWALPLPDLFITSVGSEIWRWRDGDRLRLCPDYAAHLDADWDRAAVLDALSAMRPAWQAPHEQRRWKLSLTGDADQGGRVARHLARAGLRARVIASHGRFIDILPHRAGKAAALRFEAARHGLDLSRCVAAGDSGNDADMLAASGHSILPANALAELDHLRGTRICRSSRAHAAGVIDGLARLGLIPAEVQHA